MKRIVAGCETRADAASLVEWIERFAADVPIEVLVVHVEPRVGLLMVSSVQANSDTYLRGLRRAYSRDVIGHLRDRGVSAQLEVVRGDPAHELAAAARRFRADLIVIGGARHNALHDMVLGSLERRLEHRVDIPLVVVPLHTASLHARQSTTI
jgi:nucleotide-binding universal stress UspA family protein